MGIGMKAVIAGGSGLIGGRVASALGDRGWDVAILSRSGSAPKGLRGVRWDGQTVTEWKDEFEGADLVANFCGSTIATRWTARSRKAIRDSRVLPTEAFGRAIQACRKPPRHWLNASAVGIYGDRGTRETSEATRPGTGFMAEVAAEWEAACLGCETPRTKKTILRMGAVLTPEAGLLPELLGLARRFLGGAAGSGDQYVSWIHIDDLVAMVLWAVDNGFEGVFNATAPNPVPNRVLMAELRRAAGRPWAPPVPSFAVRIGALAKGVDPSLVLEGVRAVPQQALARDFPFAFPTLRSAIANLV